MTKSTTKKAQPEVNIQTVLDKLGACGAATEWAAENSGLTPKQLWMRNPRADWLLWYAGEIGVDAKLLMRAMCACARTTLKFIAKGEKRPLQAIELAEAWCDGKATKRQVAKACGTINDLSNVELDPEAYYAMRAVAMCDVAITGYYGASYEVAEYAVSASDLPYEKAHAKLAGLIRKHISYEVVKTTREKRMRKLLAQS